jgi:hypothetical protein
MHKAMEQSYSECTAQDTVKKANILIHVTTWDVQLCAAVTCKVHKLVTLTLRGEHNLRVFANRVLRRIFGPKRDEVMGGWTKLHNEELHDLYSSPSIIRIIKVEENEVAGTCGTNGGEEERV